jgi:hypothetical protein
MIWLPGSEDGTVTAGTEDLLCPVVAIVDGDTARLARPATCLLPETSASANVTISSLAFSVEPDGNTASLIADATLVLNAFGVRSQCSVSETATLRRVSR